MESFSTADVETLFGARSPAMADDSFMTQFMDTWCPRAPGAPRPTRALPMPVPIATTLKLQINIVLFEGIPSPKSATSKNTQKRRFERNLKIPIGAGVLMNFDKSFGSKMALYVYEANKEQAVQAGNRRCNCCGKSASGFVTNITMSMPNSSGTSEAEALLEQGVMVVIPAAYPACTSTDCNRRLRDYMGYVLKTNEAEETVMCAYNECRKVEPEPGSFKLCARCHMRCYCSKECQRLAWPEHKKMCVKVPKNK